MCVRLLISKERSRPSPDSLFMVCMQVRSVCSYIFFPKSLVTMLLVCNYSFAMRALISSGWLDNYSSALTSTQDLDECH